MEAADFVVVSKADGELKTTAIHTMCDYAGSLAMIKAKDHLWAPRAQLISSRTGEGIDTFMTTAAEFHDTMSRCGHLEDKRLRQGLHWVTQHFRRLVANEMNRDDSIQAKKIAVQQAVIAGEMSPRCAARQLLVSLKHSGD
jgi:LAO/AO transport system kinase